MAPSRWLGLAFLIGLLAAGLTGAQMWLRSPGGELGLQVAPLQAHALQGASRFARHLEGLATGETSEENRKLRERIQKLEAEQLDHLETELENGRLKSLLELKQTRFKEATAASVAARDPSSWFFEVALNKGENDQVKTDMVAVSVQGLVGRVFSTSEEASRVRFILDPQSAVPVMLARSGAVGVLYGEGGYTCSIRYLDHSVEVAQGEEVLTSGLGDVYPRGLLVGRVVRNYGRTEALFQTVQVRPAVDFGRLHEVLLLEAGPP